MKNELKQIMTALGISEDLATKVLEGLSQKKITVVGEENAIPKSRLDEVIGERDGYKAQVDKINKDLEPIKQAAASVPDLQQKIQAMQTEVQQAQDKSDKAIKAGQKRLALLEGLLAGGVGDPDARELLTHRFDLEKLELDDKGKIKGFDDLLKTVKEIPALKPLFGEVRMMGPRPGEGTPPQLDLGEYALKNPFSGQHLNIALQVQISKKDPELAKRLKAAAEGVPQAG